MHRSHNVNESATYFEEHPELKFDGNNNKRAVVSAFKNPDSWLKSLRIKGRKQELCDDVNDVAGVIKDVEEIAIPVRACRKRLPFNSQCLCRKSPRKLSSDHIQRLDCRQWTFPCRRS